jgi:anti-sigma B factor antagonist
MTTDASFGDGDFAMSDDEGVGGQVCVLRVSGEIDVATAPRLRQRLVTLADEGTRVVVVDLSAVSFVDSTALGVLVSGAKRLRGDGGDLRLVVTEPHIAKVFAITGLDDVFALYASAEQAISA